MSRLMDDQQALVTNFEKLYDKFKKEGLERRTIARKEKYEQERLHYWNQIAANHDELMAASPPEGYEQRFLTISAMNDRFCVRMKTWVTEKLRTSLVLPATPGLSLTSNTKTIEGTEATGEDSKKPEQIMLSDSEDEDIAKVASSSTLERILLMMAKNQMQSKSEQALRPPNLEIEVFNGDIRQYRTFKTLFNRAVSRTKWNEIEMFTFLQSKLSGDAADLIDDFEVTEESYDLAWDILNETYNQRRKLLQCLVATMIDANLKVQYNNAQSAAQFLKAFQSILVNVKQLNCTVEELIVEIFLPKMDKKTRGRFEDYIGHTTNTPEPKKVSEFLHREKDVWQILGSPTTKTSSRPTQQTKVHVTSDSKTSSASKCFICGKPHSVLECDQFLSSSDRDQLLRKHKVCVYCAAHAYSRTSPCRKKRSLKCDICQGNHITLLHPLECDDSSNQYQSETPVMLTENTEKMCTVLPTAIAKLLDRAGSECFVRCLIDLCAERTYVSENIVQLLKLKKHRIDITVSGLNGISGKVKHYVHLTLKLDDPRLDDIEVEALVVPRISGMLPSSVVPTKFYTSNRQLADPAFHTQSFVGALIGGDIAPRLFKTGIPNEITPDGFLLQPTHLGWIVSGGKANTKQYISTFVTMNENMEKMSHDQELTQRILNFYELPEYDDTTSCESDFCELIFQDHHYRLPDGRYVVPMPWKRDSPSLGHSYRKAVTMFKGQEGKWLKNKVHYDMSNQFMREYEAMGHMSRINASQDKDDSNNVFYIPYLSILRKDSLTTKLRNVFNASMPSSNGISLNDTMWEGPKLQTNIKDMVLKSRSFPFIYSADISKMFRQILIRPEDRDKLRIIWRPSPQEPLREYKLNTVTYGTDAAPFLAIRTIQQCATDNASPEISSIIHKAFYVDDLLYGSDTIEQAKQEIDGIKTALSAGKFPLTKWMSNDNSILSDIPENERITAYIGENKTEVKLLGSTYDFEEDNFRLNLKEPESYTFTKRGISSAAASFYDPLGFLLPFIMILRIFLQRVWKEKLDWDDKLTDEHQKEFKQLMQGINNLNSIKIPRYIAPDSENMVEFIGFADASSHAQAAVIYSRVKTQNGYKITLVTARGNVSKWKTAAVIGSKQNTIPKLELEALLTLAELYKSLKDSFEHRSIKFTAYTDSLVALAWVRSRKKKLDNKFVERRVIKIRGIFNPENLHHVKSEENPADPASRGLTASQLSTSALWFLGPSWLQHDELPTTPFCNDSKCLVVSTTNQEEPEADMFSKYSSWIRVLRIVAYCLSWQLRTPGCIKADDIKRAKICILRYYQMLYLHEAIQTLQQGKTVPKNHWLYRLSPFVDKHHILRVGGRLGNANEISENQRHPIVIPKSHGLNLLVRYTHLMNDHASNSLMLRLLIEEYWIPGVKAIIKSCINKCPTCIRYNARTIQPQMAQLPKERVTPSSTFEKVGVDLCGPFSIKASPLRHARTFKVWIVTFICLSTKATHLEIVTSLSSEHFLAAFSRFCCRRGTSSEVWSDNGTNFVGAHRYLRTTWEQIIKDCENRTAIQEVSWKFIPRHSPTFGGLWEASVKSLKYFLKRMADVRNLTFEELQTLLCKVEALLNSRPLCANPLTPQEEPALTPFHFINQRGYKPSSMEAAPKVPLTKKWLLIHSIQQDLWQRFRTEYLRELQAKVKWQKPQPNLCVDDLVLIKEPYTSPGDWRMGRVSKTYPDPDGVVRKVDVFKANKSTTLHAVNRLVPLMKTFEEVPEIPESPDITTNLSCNNDDIQNKAEKCTNASSLTSQRTDTACQLKKTPSTNVKPHSLRRNARLTNITLVHLCLLVLAVPFISVTSSPIEQLSSGIFTKKLGQTYMKKFDLEFSVKTNINFTHDLHIIHETAEEFHEQCLKMSGNSKPIIDQCATLQTSLSQLAEETASDILNSYNQRSKRWISLTSKTLWKAAPAVATAVGMVYQESQIHNLQKKLTSAESQLKKTANVLLNVTDLEYEAIEGKLNEVIRKQQEILLAETIIAYAQKLEMLYNHLRSRHFTATSITPLKELADFAQPILDKMPTMRLPDIGEQIFNIYEPRKFVKNDFTIISFTIPVVSTTLMDMYILVSIPENNGNTILFNNNDKFQRILINPNTLKYADVTSNPTPHPLISETISMIAMDDCLTSLFPDVIGDKCKHTTIQNLNDEIIPVSSDITLVFTNIELHTYVECNGIRTSYSSPALLVNTTECSVITDTRILGSREPTLIKLNDEDDYTMLPSVPDGIEVLTHNPLAVELRASLKTSPIPTEPGYLISYTLGLLTFIMFLIIMWRCLGPNKQQERWYPEFTGPESRRSKPMTPSLTELPAPEIV